MADVFISYSRKDKTFVQRLDEALTQRGREAWVDWEGIRPTEEFMQAIYGAIEGADTFIFVLSPDSVSSVVCGKEIAHAVAHNKRIVPLVARDVNAAEVPEALAKLNWIFCRESDDFATATDTLVSALDTDLDWVHAHTRLLTRAVEWEAKGQNNSFVLRGDDLRAAERWLTEAGADKERQPTQLQTAYIIASRKAAARRQRITLGAVSFGAVVALGFAIIAMIQRGEARKQTGIAADNATKAIQTLSQADFAQGTRLIADQHPAQALAFLARAVRANGHPAAAGRIGSLLMERVWPLPVESPHADAVKTFFSPTGAHAVVVLADGSAEIRENATAKAISPRIRLEAGVDVACFSPDGTRVALAGDAWKEGEPNEPVPLAVQLWDTNTGHSIAEAAHFQGGGSEETFVFSPDSRFLAIRTGGGKMFVWETRTGRDLRQFEASNDVQFSHDGERMLTLGDTVQVIETRTGKPIGVTPKLPKNWSVGAVAISPDGQRIATAGNLNEGEGYGGSEQVWDLKTGKPIAPPMEHQSWVSRLEFSPGGQWLLALGHAEARVWNTQTGEPVTGWLKNPGAEGLVAAAFSPDGRLVATVAEGESVCIWDVASGVRILQPIELPAATTAQFSRDGQRLIAGGSNGFSRFVWDLMGASEQALTLPGKASVQHGFKLANFEPGLVRVWDIRSAKILLEARLDPPKKGEEEELASGSFDADGNRLLVRTGLGARLWDLRSGQEFPRLADARLAELNRDGSKILCIDKSVTIFEAETARLLHEIKPDNATEEFIDALWSPDGRMVTISSRRGESAGVARLWDAGSGQPVSPPLAHPAPPASNFSPDGVHLVTLCVAGDGAEIRFWKLPTLEIIGEPVKIFLEPSEGLPKPEFSPDGQRFAIFARGGMRLFETATGKLIIASTLRKSEYTGAQFSRDSMLLAAAGNSIQIWNAATGALLIDPVKPPEHMSYQHVEFSADGRRVLADGIGGPEATWGSTTIVDVATGRLISESRTDEFTRRVTHFSPDDCLVVEKMDTDAARVWDVVPPGKGPPWLAELAEAVGGCTLTDNGTLEISPDRGQRLAAVRKKVADLPADDRWAQLARWFLAEPRARMISPYSSVKVADYVERRVKANTMEKLTEALAASPADPLARAAFGVQLLTDSSDPRAFGRADGETLFATKLAPENPIVWQARTKVLSALKRPAEAAAAAKKAAELARPLPPQAP